MRKLYFGLGYGSRWQPVFWHPVLLQVNSFEGEACFMKQLTTPLVMIVEDNPDSIYLMERYARSSGCRALVTAQGKQATVLARREKPAVIFLDIQLSGTTGWEVLKALRADPDTHAIPIILCTVLDVAVRAHAVGVGYRPKPIYYKDFLSALRDVAIALPST